MIIVHQYKQARTHKLLIQVHYFINGKYQKSSAVFEKDEDILRHLTKGHANFSLTNVANKVDLAFIQYTTH